MKPEIIKKWDMRAIKGYVGVICEFGNVLHVKNIPECAREWITIECPCGSEIHTIYTRDTFVGGRHNE